MSSPRHLAKPLAPMTDDDRKALIIIAEEASEVAKQALKTARFGFHAVDEAMRYDNVGMLRAEMKDLSRAMDHFLFSQMERK